MLNKVGYYMDETIEFMLPVKTDTRFSSIPYTIYWKAEFKLQGGEYFMSSTKIDLFVGGKITGYAMKS